MSCINAFPCPVPVGRPPTTDGSVLCYRLVQVQKRRRYSVPGGPLRWRTTSKRLIGQKLLGGGRVCRGCLKLLFIETLEQGQFRLLRLSRQAKPEGVPQLLV